MDIFIKTWCIHPWSWCGGGNIPREARRADTIAFELSNGGHVPCQFFKNGRCTHPRHPNRVKEAALFDE